MRKFYSERIDLASKLRNANNGGGVSHFHAKSPLTNFQTLTHQISLLAGLHTLSNLFTKKPKKPILEHKGPFSLYFKFELIWDELPLKLLCLTR